MSVCVCDWWTSEQQRASKTKVIEQREEAFINNKQKIPFSNNSLPQQRALCLSVQLTLVTQLPKTTAQHKKRAAHPKLINGKM